MSAAFLLLLALLPAQQSVTPDSLLTGLQYPEHLMVAPAGSITTSFLSEDQPSVTLHGPGLLQRFEATTVGTLKLEFAGLDAIELDLASLADGQQTGFPLPLVALEDGWVTCSLPLPYSDELILTVSGGAQVSMQSLAYPAGTITPNGLGLDQEAVSTTAAALAVEVVPDWTRMGLFVGPCSKKFPFRYQLKADGLIRWMEFTFIAEPEGVSREELLRSLHFSLARMNPDDLAGPPLPATFDVPLGDLFGHPGEFGQGGTRAQASDGGDTFWLRYPMPIPKGTRIYIYNEAPGKGMVRFKMRAAVEPGCPDMHLHAQFVQGQTTPGETLELLSISGDGILAGTTLGVRNESRTPHGLTPVVQAGDSVLRPGAWWGRGGSDLYQTPFSARTRLDGPGDFGYSSYSRPLWDAPIPFQGGLTLSAEAAPNAAPVEIGATVFWYAPSKFPYETTHVAVEKRQYLGFESTGDFQVMSHAHEGEKMTMMQASGGRVVTTELQGALRSKASRGEVAMWSGAREAQQAIWSFGIERSGFYNLDLNLVAGPNAAVIQAYLDGRRLGKAIDLRQDSVAMRKVSFGERELAAREHRLTLRIVSNAPEAGAEIGLDCLQTILAE